MNKKKLRCFCSSRPLLAMYGIDDKGNLFVHVKIYKQHKVYGETIYRGGEISIRCRCCYRWHDIKFVNKDEVRLQARRLPKYIADFIGTENLTDQELVD